TPSVNVANSPTVTISGTPTVQPVETPFQQVVNASSSISTEGCDPIVVPPGKTLTIESFSAETFSVRMPDVYLMRHLAQPHDCPLRPSPRERLPNAEQTEYVDGRGGSNRPAGESSTALSPRSCCREVYSLSNKAIRARPTR